MKHYSSLLFTLLLWAGTLSAAVYTPSMVPDPKQAGQNYYVVNPDNIINAEDVDALNAICTDLDQRCRVELAIVCLDSIDEKYDMFTFGYELFQAWGIGKEGQNNGVLLTLCRSRHEVRFNTGSGIEIYLTDAECSRIINEYMIPLFIEDDYAGGLVMGAMRIEEICSDDEIAEELLTLRSVTNRGGYERGGRNDIYQNEEEDEPWYIYTPKLFGFTLAIVALTFLVLLPVFYQGKKQSIKKEIKQRRGWCIAWGIILFLIMALADWIDYTPAIVLGVVPVFMYMRSFVRCEKCGKFGRHTHSSVITQSATYEEPGEEAYTYTCCNCGHTHHYKVVIPKLTHSSSGSGSGGSSGGSSGGGSWGGGSTSGGGAGGRW